MTRALTHRDGTRTESKFDSAVERASLLQGMQDRKLFSLKAAKIHEKVHAMNCQIDRSGLQASHGGHLLAFLPLVEGIARYVGARVVLNCQKQVIDWIVQIQQMNVRLKPQTQLRRVSAGQGFGLKRRLRSTIKSVDFGPLEAHHVERKFKPANRMLGVLAKPRFKSRTEIAHREGARRTSGQIRLGYSVEAAVTQDRAQPGKIFREPVKHPKPILSVVNFEPLERCEAIIRFDDLLSYSRHRQPSTANR